MGFVQYDQWQIYDAAGRRKYINATERALFLAQADRLAPHLRALCYALVYSGARISELLALTRHQLDADGHALTIRTLKRRRLKFRVIPIPPEITAMLLALQPTVDGRFWTLHRTTAWRLVKRLMEGGGVSGPMACNRGLRHGFGIRAAGRNVPLSTIRKMMGHASLNTTMIYLDAIGAEEREFAERMW